MVKAIFFDVGGVLIQDDSKRIFDRQSQLLGVDRKRLIITMHSDRRRLMKGIISRREYLKRISVKLNTRRLSSLELGQIFPARTVHHWRTWAIAKRLWRRGYIVGIITNVFPPHRFLPQVRFSYPPFWPIIRSYEVHSAKPERKVFDIAVQRAGVRFAEAIFFDDRPDNVAAAARLGMKTFLYKKSASLARQLRRYGVKI